MITFDELCGSALGSADYTAMAEAFHTIFVRGVPVMTLAHGDQARPVQLPCHRSYPYSCARSSVFSLLYTDFQNIWD